MNQKEVNDYDWGVLHYRMDVGILHYGMGEGIVYLWQCLNILHYVKDLNGEGNDD